jgi:large subunit ribosomal protein L25
MKLQTKKRAAERKSENTQLRLKGMVPAVVYHRGRAAHSIAISLNDYESIVRKVKPGRLSTTVMTLSDEEGKERKAILKEIQYHPTTYGVLHLDFEELDDGVHVSLNVPLETTGLADCVGVKQGGSLRQTLHKIRVQCLPKDIPQVFSVDVTQLEINQSVKVQDIKVPKGVKTLVSGKEVALAIAKR